jgi:hypothetical protein
MRTTLRQGAQEVVLDHKQGCQTEYLEQLSEAMASGMSLRITYWGESAKDMSWMDTPPCGPETCIGANAGYAVVNNITIGEVPTQKISISSKWIVSDQSDALYGQVVPASIVNDSALFIGRGNMGIVEWRDAAHFVKRVEGTKSAEPEFRSADDLGMIMRRFEDFPQTNRPASSSFFFSSSAFLTFAMVTGLFASAVVGICRWQNLASTQSLLPSRARAGSIEVPLLNLK